jgi:excinuclease UvrABC nuclease subunit
MSLPFELTLDRESGADFEAVPDQSGIFLIELNQGRPYLGKTAFLRRRLRRLLARREGPARLTNLSDAAARVSYLPSGSGFESAFHLYGLARRHLPETYRRYLKLRLPPLIKVQLSNEYPRTYVTNKLSRGRALYYGPFFNRASAEKFESAFLDLFKIRRCPEDLEPDPAHPGCIYGEMEMCMRPCQARSSLGEYHGEVGRVLDFLHSNGDSLVREIEAARDWASGELEFEEAARQHRRLDKVLDALKLKDPIAREIDRLFGVIVQRSVEESAVELWLIYKGCLQPNVRFRYDLADGRSTPLDGRLRASIEAIEARVGGIRERSDHLAILNRWFHSSWRDGEAVFFDGMDAVPYRKLVRTVSKIAQSDNPVKA